MFKGERNQVQVKNREERSVKRAMLKMNKLCNGGSSGGEVNLRNEDEDNGQDGYRDSHDEDSGQNGDFEDEDYGRNGDKDDGQDAGGFEDKDDEQNEDDGQEAVDYEDGGGQDGDENCGGQDGDEYSGQNAIGGFEDEDDGQNEDNGQKAVDFEDEDGGEQNGDEDDGRNAIGGFEDEDGGEQDTTGGFEKYGGQDGLDSDDEDGGQDKSGSEDEQDGSGIRQDGNDSLHEMDRTSTTMIVNQYVPVHIPVHVPVPVACYVPSNKAQHRSAVVTVIEKNDEATKYYTGLATWKLFEFLLDFLLKTCPGLSKSTKNSPADRLLLVMMRLRLNLRVEDLAYRFGIKTATVSVIFERWINAMFSNLGFLVKWPSQETVRANMPQIFKELYPRARCIIDCSEIFIERPTAYQARAKTYSNYKSHNTVKFLVGITPNGAISFLSKCWGGRATDKQITRNSGFLDMVEHGDVILADRGFDITDDLGVFGVRLEIPSFTRGKKQLSLQEVEYSKRLSKVRIHVERVIGLLKNKYTILQGTLPLNMLKHKNDTVYANIDKMLTVCAALVNLSPSVVPM